MLASYVFESLVIAPQQQQQQDDGQQQGLQGMYRPSRADEMVMKKTNLT